MKLRDLQTVLEKFPGHFPRFILPNGNQIPAHVHVTEVGRVVRNFIDCGGVTGKEEKAVLQTHVGDDTEHRLRSDRLIKILQVGQRALPITDLEVDVEYDCCVVSRYPVGEARPESEFLNLVLERSRTQCRARERRETASESCCTSAGTCC